MASQTRHSTSFTMFEFDREKHHEVQDNARSWL